PRNAIAVRHRSRRQQSQFAGIYGRMVLRAVSIPAKKKPSPDDADRAEKQERLTPGHILENPDHQQRCERSSPTCCRPENSLGPGSLRRGKPGRERLGNDWEGACFADAE